MSECEQPVTKWRMCNGPAGHEGEHANPWYDEDAEYREEVAREMAEYLGEDPFADTIEERLLP
jgi:hypothetical protein